jgi:hypothetical protein
MGRRWPVSRNRSGDTLREAISAYNHRHDQTPRTGHDELARVVLELAGHEQPPYILTPEEEADLDASIAEAERGEFATDAEIRAIWAKHATIRTDTANRISP